MNRTTSILVKDHEILMSIGIYPVEKQAHQRVIVNIRAECLLPHSKQDDIAKTVSYETFIETVKRLAAARHYNLAESFAEEIAAALLEDVRINSVYVRCEKPDIFKGNPAAVGVEITRSR